MLDLRPSQTRRGKTASGHGASRLLLLIIARGVECSARAIGCSLSDVQATAARLGCSVVVKAWGPAYRLELHSSSPLPEFATASGEQSTLLGYTDGFTQPTGIVHLEGIQLRRFTGYWSRRQGSGARRYKDVPRGKAQNGLGLLLGIALFCWINESAPFSCKRAQLLAILDDPRQHRILVRYYRLLGFKPVREVGDGLGSIGDLMAWGGNGLLMEVSVEAFLERNAPKLQEL